MKIMTFNIQHCHNYIYNKVEYEMLAEEIKNISPDILGINEIYGDESSIYGDQVKRLVELTGYKYYYFAKAFDHEHGPYGNAILSKFPIVKCETIIVPSPENKRNPEGYYETRCLLVGDLIDGTRAIVTHFGLNEDEVEKEINVLLGYIKGEKCIFMGDLNSVPNDSILNPIREKMLDASAGFCYDTYTFSSLNPSKKIDYIFVSSDIKVKEAYVLEKVLSDHFAHIAIIED